MNKVLKYNDKILSIGGGSTGETWVINENPRPYSTTSWNTENINFTSNGTSYSTFSVADCSEMPLSQTELFLKYNDSYVYYFNQFISVEGKFVWQAQAYRTVTFATAPTGDLLTWLQTNAVKQTTSNAATKILVIDHSTRIYIVSGGTATGVQLTEYSSAEQATLKQELVIAGTFTASELADTTILNITGTAVGTVILDVSELGNIGDAIKIVHKKTSSGTWETLYSGVIPASRQVTVTLTEFSPITGAKTTLPQLATPANLNASGTVVNFDPVEHATSYEVFANGVSIGTYTPSTWEDPIQEGSNLTITQTYSGIQSGTDLTIN